MVAPIGVVASPSQGVSYYQRDGFYAQDNAAHLQAILEGRVPGGQHLGRRRDGESEHRPDRDVTVSAPKLVSLMAMLGGNERIIEGKASFMNHTSGKTTHRQ